MEDNNVIRMDEHKNKNKVHKISFKKILLGFIVCIALSILVIAGTCKTKKIKIDGLSYYTQAEHCHIFFHDFPMHIHFYQNRHTFRYTEGNPLSSFL